jgi:tRNA-Thr(GGU) m(6)t(6)A37 methyltransferase TsaA
VSSYEVTVIGVVGSTLTDRAAAPRQGDEGGSDAWITVDTAFAAALDGIAVGDRIVVLTWLHLGNREVLRTHPRGDTTRPEQGVFSTRSPDRPNPIGLHPVEVLAIDDTRLHVAPIEAIAGTPVIDIKPEL